MNILHAELKVAASFVIKNVGSNMGLPTVTLTIPDVSQQILLVVLGLSAAIVMQDRL